MPRLGKKDAREQRGRGLEGRERGFLGRGQQTPTHQLDGLGSAVSSPSGVWGTAPAKIEFGAFWP